ncbi:MAG: hypothetical protein AABX85_03505 [Nanoarchaeota archaeon]
MKIDKTHLQIAGLATVLGINAALAISAESNIEGAMNTSGMDRYELMQKYDTDRNGILSKSELKAFERDYTI